MPEKILCHFTTLRYVHDTTTEEFANVGVVVFVPSTGQAVAKMCTDLSRIERFFPGINQDHLLEILHHLQTKLSGTSTTKHLRAHLWEILPQDDSSLQWGTVGGGLADEVESFAANLFTRMVTRYQPVR